MVAKLSTTINKIQRLSNSSNIKIINEFLIYMKNNGSSERHQNNIIDEFSINKIISTNNQITYLEYFSVIYFSYLDNILKYVFMCMYIHELSKQNRNSIYDTRCS